MMSSRIWAYSNLTLAMIIVGSSVVFGKIITTAFPIFLASGLRFAIACAILFPILIWSEKQLFNISKKDVYSLLAMAFAGQVVFTFFVLLGLRYTSAVEAGLITSTSPGMMALVTYLFFREKPGRLQVLAVCLVVAGVVSVNGVFSLDSMIDGAGHITGNLLMVGAVVREAFFLLMRKRISSEVSDLALTGYLCLSGLIIFLPLSVYQALSFDFSSLTPGAWGAMVYFGAVFTVLAYLFWFKGVAMVSGTVAGIFTAVMPVSAVLLSCLFLKESFTMHHAGGGVLILLSIILCAVSSKKTEHQDLAKTESGL